MKAAYIEQTGPPETIIYGDLPKPSPGSGSAGQSPCLVREPGGHVHPQRRQVLGTSQPFIVGCDLAGTIEEVGPQVRHFRVGERVWCTNQGLLGRQGTFAEYCVVDESWANLTPEGTTDEAAAACALVGVTAHLGLFRDARLKKGETVFVHGGTGGVGSMVVQMAKAVDARVITTGGSDEKVARCRELGADLAINYRTEDVGAAIRQFAPGGVDMFWETLREPDFDNIVGCLAERGRIVLMAGRDARPAFPVGPFYVNCSMYGVVMFKATAEELQNCGDEINLWFVEGKLQPQIA